MSKFVDNAKDMLSGGSIATILGFISVWIIGNLYSPESVAAYRIFLSFGGIFALLLTLRIELSIVISKNIQSAEMKGKSLILYSFLISLFFILISIFLPSSFLDNLIGLDSFFLALIVVFGFAVATSEIVQQFYTYVSRFNLISILVIAIQVSFIACLFIFSFMEQELLGPSISRLVAYFGVVFFFLLFQSRYFIYPKLIPYKDLIIENQSFPKKNLPYSIIGLISFTSPVLILTIMGYQTLAGIFTFLFTLALFPGSFMNNYLGKVFFKKASELVENNLIYTLMLVISKTILFFVIPLLVIFFSFGRVIISNLFGEQWLDLDFNFVLIFISGFLYLFSSWPERIFVIKNLQGRLLVFQFLSDFFILTCLFASMYLGLSAEEILLLYLGLNYIYHCLFFSFALNAVGSSFGITFFSSISFLILILILLFMIPAANLTGVELLIVNILFLFIYFLSSRTFIKRQFSILREF